MMKYASAKRRKTIAMAYGKKSFSILTLGCKVNAYESQALKEEMTGAGYIYRSELPADIVFVNTCAVTSQAEKKDLEKIRSLRRNFPDTEVVALGCFCQLHPERLEGLGLKAVIGTSGRNSSVGLIQKEGIAMAVDKNSRLFSYEEQEITSFGTEKRAFIKIQDGCDNFCSYCIIPFTRGVSRSRKKEDVLNEIRRLALNGYKEMVLTGIDTGSYHDGDEDFSSLVGDILEVEPKTFRVRISSLEMSQIDEKLISLMERDSRLVPHFHIPLQSGSEDVLLSMGRKYDLKRFLSLCEEIKKRIPRVALSTDVICGFPGESEEDFEKTCQFVKKAGFMRLHCFPYSKRPFTKASRMAGQLDNGVKKERVRKLSKIGEGLSKDFMRSMEGEKLTVLIDEKCGEGLYWGYSENYILAKVRSQEDLVGKMIKGRLVKDGIIEDYIVL